MNDAKAEDKPGAAGVRPAQAAVPRGLQMASGPLLPENDDFEVELADVLDTPVLQQMMEDFYDLTGIGMAIVNHKGAILVATGWRDMCTMFHRVHPETRRHCVESDTVLSTGVDPGSFKIYRCKNNLWDMATPIMLGDRHAGNLFLGQFIFEDEEPDREIFREQAKRYGFDEAAYLAALDRLPRWSRERVNQAMAFFTSFARQISLQDITDQKQTEAALRESEEKFRTIAEKMGDVVWTLDLNLNVTYVSPSIVKVIGCSPEERMHQSLDEMMTPESCARVMETLQAELALENAPDGDPDRVISIEVEYYHKDGHLIWMENIVRGIRDDVGRLIGIYGVSRDITSRKQAEAAIRESEEKYRLIFNHAPLGLFYFDADGVIRDCNDVFVGIIGSSREALIGLNMMNLKDQGIVSAVRNAIDGNIGFYEGVYHSVTSAKVTPIRAIFTSMTSKNGFSQGGVGIIEDVTRYKQAEDEKEKLRNQLMQAQKMESIGRLAGGVAHDFNNMLSVILGHTELAMDEIDPVHPLYADLKEIDHAACRSADLVRQLLAFARKQTITPRILDLNETVEGMLKMLRRLIGEHIDLVWLPGKQLWPVRMDPSQIDQILANLCVNSRDAIDGAGRITIETDNVTIDQKHLDRHSFFIPGDYVLLAVTDDGCGMDTETLSHLFEPFFTTKEVGEGTGLGLATIHGIVHQNNGFIDLDTAPDRGTTFKIYIPRHQTAVEAGEAEALPKAPVSGGNEMVLLVEDEPSILKMGKTFLERMGYRVLTAATPAEAINVAREHAEEIHLLMTDVIMPEMNGRDLAVHVASLYPQIKCLYMSGYTADIIAGHGVLDDSVHFIHKPFSRAELAAKVREALSE